MVVLATGAVQVSDGQKWAAAAIALALIAILWIFVRASTGSWNPWRLVEGADGAPSTSKLQWFVWLLVIIYSYALLWTVRAFGGDYSALSHVPTNLLAVLGFSGGTMVAAKGITSSQVSSKQVAKRSKSTAVGAVAPPGGILADDSGEPELAKVQIVGFTIIAVGIFLATVLHQLRTTPVHTSLPNIDSSLLVLMGISQGAYLGKKLVTAGSPGLYQPSNGTVKPGSSISVEGVSLGASQAGSELLINGHSVSVTAWSDTSLSFPIPLSPPGGPTYWGPNQEFPVRAVVKGQATNVVNLKVGPPPEIKGSVPKTAAVGAQVEVEYEAGA